VQDEDLTLGIAMTDAQGATAACGRTSRQIPTSICTSSNANGRGIVISGTKAIVTGAPLCA
jgi:4-hydroxybutyryl-CoA dehydratase/vinylacetyl-CoA-Delta-isomerase